MEKFTKLKYSEVETKKNSEFETSFSVAPLERGFGNTLGNALRRVLLSSIYGIAPIAVKIASVAHEFQTINGVVEDAVQVILNLKKVRFVYNESLFSDENSVLKLTLKANEGEVLARDFHLPAGLEVVNTNEYIATVSKGKHLELELFLVIGRGFVSFEDNKERIKKIVAKFESKLNSGSIIAMDSDFSPVVNVAYEVVELNSSSATIEERLTINVRTDGSIPAKEALAKAAHILMGHLEVISNVANITREEIFIEKSSLEKSSLPTTVLISQLDLSVRSFNCLKRAGFETLDQLSQISREELEKIKNLGKKSVEEILEKLSEYNIELKDTKERN